MNNLGTIETKSRIVTHEQYVSLFNKMNPGFFERDYVKAVPDDDPAFEMLLRLQEFDAGIYEKSFDDRVSFGNYEGDLESLIEAVRSVRPHWVQFFDGHSKVYCGYIDGKIASFCVIEDYGEYTVNGMEWKIGGPGCVGTIPRYRNRGIGLTMIKKATQRLIEEQYDYSYVHFTYKPVWYSKLGYKTILTWSGRGIID